MLKRFKTKELVFIALIAALMFVLDIFLVSVIDTISGIPGAGFLVDTILFVAVLVIVGLTVRKFGTFTLAAFVYSALAIPTNIFGPPGVYKLILGIILGLIVDIILVIFNYRKAGYYIAPAIANILLLPLLLYALALLGLPGSEQLSKYLWFFVGIIFFESLIGSWIGISLYDKKISRMRIVRQIGS